MFFEEQNFGSETVDYFYTLVSNFGWKLVEGSYA